MAKPRARAHAAGQRDSATATAPTMLSATQAVVLADLRLAPGHLEVRRRCVRRATRSPSFPVAPTWLGAFHHAMRLLAPALAVLLLASCADNIYYQTRYAPTSASGSFGTGERLFRTEDREVYELPANPPAVSDEENDLHRSRKDCRRPGQMFKPGAVVGIEAEEIHGRPQADTMQLAKLSDEPAIGKSEPIAPLSLVSMHDEFRGGTREGHDLPPVSGMEDRPPVFRGSGTTTIPANAMAAYGDDDSYCPPKQ